jgi:hypothetical protein
MRGFEVTTSKGFVQVCGCAACPFRTLRLKARLLNQSTLTDAAIVLLCVHSFTGVPVSGV